VRAQREGMFGILEKNNFMSFFGILNSFQPSLGESHENLGSYVILEATDKTFWKKSIKHALCSES
jgi:hypothetical protein